MSTTNTLRRSRPRNPGKLAIAAAMALIVPLLASCSGESAAEPADRKIGTTIEELTELAQEEGKVHLIAYPDDWANYAASFAAFEEKFGVEVEVSSPDASSAEELQAVETLKGQSTQPDVLDIGYSFVDPAKERGLVDHYVPTVAGEIPENLKDPDGYWTGAYYGVLSIGVDANVVDVPETWADLKDPQYKGKIAIGDPRAGASQLAAVLAAAIANGGSVEDIQPGIDFFTELADEGYLVAASDGALQTGEAAVTFDWNYNYSGVKEQMQRSGIDLQDVVPGDGVFGNFLSLIHI